MLYYVAPDYMEESGWQSLEEYLNDKAVEILYSEGTARIADDVIGLIEVLVHKDGSVTHSYTSKDTVMLFVEGRVKDIAADDDSADRRMENWRRMWI